MWSPCHWIPSDYQWSRSETKAVAMADQHPVKDFTQLWRFHCCAKMDPHRSTLRVSCSFTLFDPGYLRQLTILLYDFQNYSINLYHIMHVHFTRSFTHVPVILCYLEFHHFTAISKKR